MSQLLVRKTACLTGHNDCIYTVVNGEDPFIFSGAGDGMVVKWRNDVENDGVLVAKLNHSVYSIAYHKDANQLIVGENFEGLHLIDLSNNKEVASLRLGNTEIFDLKIVESFLYATTGNGNLIEINLQDFRITRKLKCSLRSARSVAVGKKLLFVGCSDNNIKVIDKNDFVLLKELSGHDNSVFCVSLSQNEQQLLSTSRDAHFKVWDCEKLSLTDDVIAHMYAINHVAYRPQGDLFATCSMDKSIKVWDAQTKRLLKVLDKTRHAGHGTSINKLAWSADGERLVSCSDDRQLALWSIKK